MRGKIARVERSKRFAILLLGGSACRFGGPKPKQLLPVNGKPLFCYALNALASSSQIDEIILVVRADIKEEVAKILKSLGLNKPIHYVMGGASRSESVHNAVSYLEKKKTQDEDIVLIQDADRPNLDERLIQEGIEKAAEIGASVTAIPCSDSVFISEDLEHVSSYQKRETTFLAQTPQTFRFHLLKKLSFAEISTDEASQIHALGVPVSIVKGSQNNYKINYPEDLERFAKEEKK